MAACPQAKDCKQLVTRTSHEREYRRLTTEEKTISRAGHVPSGTQECIVVPVFQLPVELKEKKHTFLTMLSRPLSNPHSETLTRAARPGSVFVHGFTDYHEPITELGEVGKTAEI